MNGGRYCIPRLVLQPLLYHKRRVLASRSTAILLPKTAATAPPTMAGTEKHYLIFILLIIFFQISSGHTELVEDATEPPNPPYLLSKTQARRTLAEFILDYDYGGHNIKHEYMKGKPGVGSKNP
ncbi:hypothetical protein Cni_G11880 [Canna indica]|uniref:Uncharacterized protein n=1 Tax=Canna indica TaxID=4628 RepID=A0AAQ3K749_9LILI|nr:hypothetical protein Cni_G11880 [Canna indica]